MKKEKQQVLAAAVLTGIASMIYELVWVRYLGLVLGNSVYAVGVVTACYMTGMALGDFLIGTWASSHYRQAKTVTFAGLAVCCLLSPVFYRLISAVNQIGAGCFDSGVPQIFWRAAVSFLVLLAPTAFIGGILPVLMGGMRAEDSSVYAANTLGTVAGAVLTGFFLIPAAGLSGSMTAAAGCVLCGMFFVRSVSPGISETENKGNTGNRGGDTRRKNLSSAVQPVYKRTVRILSLIVYGISGFTGMAFQVYQTKILTLFFMDSVYDFAVILAVYIGGLFIGNTVSAVWAGKTKKHAEILAGSQILLGICSVFTLYLISRFPGWTAGITSQGLMQERFGNHFFAVGLLMKTALTGLLLLVPAVLWGMAYPMVSRICKRENSSDSQTAGVLLGWNTLWSAAGSFLASFVMIQLLGIQKAVMVNGCMNLAGGVILFAVGKETWKERMIVSGVSAAVSAAVLAGVPQWDRFEMSTSFLKPGQDVDGYVNIRYYKEDAYGITSVVDFLPYQETYLTTNRLYCQNTSNMSGPEDHRRLSYIPLMIHPDPQKVLIEGLGAGMTLRGAVEYGGADIDCVEISEAVAEAAREFANENNHALESEKVNLIIDDARNYLLTSDQTYDVIIADLFFPMSSGSGNMFSREYYQSCLKSLSQGGLMAQWIPLHQFSPEELEITMKTFCQVFPYTSVWFGMIGDSVPAAGLIGGREPLKVSFDHLISFYDGRREHNMDLTNTALDDPYMFFSHFIRNVTQEDFLAEIPCNTDNKPVLEYLNPAGYRSYKERGAENVNHLLELRQPAREIADFSSGGSEKILSQYEEETEDFIRAVMKLEPEK